MAWVKHEKKKGNFFTFENQGDEIIGVVINIREIDTVNGRALVVNIERDNNEVITTFVSAGMSVDESLLGKLVKIVFLGYEKNPKTKRMYKAFDVYVSDVSQPELFDDAPF